MKQQIKSLTGFINRRISIIYLIVLVISIPLIYFISIAQLEKESSSELNSLLITLEKMNPKMVSDRVTKEDNVAFGITTLLQVHGRYFYRYVARANAQTNLQFSDHNKQIMNQFKSSPDLKSIDGKLDSGSLELVYKAKPVVNSGELEGFIMFGIKHDRYSDIIIVRVATFIGMMTILYAIIISSINTTLRSHVINPLLRINNRTRAVANGDIDKVFESKRQDEVGELIKSIELLRRSLSISMSMHDKK